LGKGDLDTDGLTVTVLPENYLSPLQWLQFRFKKAFQQIPLFKGIWVRKICQFNPGIENR
uniref:hypothetical protein n=1 Tax=Cyclobacterium roseum TaxID=2666137 RepID=UPI001F1D49E7